MLQHNIGRDISKFFHGGYSLENNLGPNPAKGYTHSALARIVVNDLAVAVYEPKCEAEVVQCRVASELCQNVNATTKTIVFETVNKQKVSQWRNYQDDLSFLGKHYLVWNIDGGAKVARHYTICNAMRPDVYSAYIKALKPESDPEYVALDTRMLETQSQH